jgi:hypothetical protein
MPPVYQFAMEDLMNKDYYPFPESAIKQEAAMIQARVNTRKKRGIPITSDMVWAWIKERHPTWPELEREKVFREVKY